MIPILKPSIFSLLVPIGYDTVNTILEKQVEIKQLEKHLEFLPIWVSLLYCFSNIDGIHKSEELEIEKFYRETFNLAFKLADEKKIEYKKIQKTKESIEKILNIKEDIKLSVVLKRLISIEDKNMIMAKIDEAIHNVINADGKHSYQEINLFNRYLEFSKSIKTENQQKINKVIQKIERYELYDKKPLKYYLCTDSISFLEKGKAFFQETLPIKVSTKEIKVLNHYELVEGKYYIEHPMNSKYLLAVEDLNKIDDLITEELLHIVALLGVQKAEIYTYSETSTKKKEEFEVNVGIDHIKVSGNGDYKNLNNNENFNSSSKKIIREYQGEKEDKQNVLDRLLWLKGQKQIQNLIDLAYSRNPTSLWEEEIHIKSIINDSVEYSLGVGLKVMMKLGLNISFNDNEYIKKLEKEVKRIRLEF